MDFDAFCEIASDAVNSIGFLRHYGILPEEMICEQCSQKMVEHQRNDISDKSMLKLFYCKNFRGRKLHALLKETSILAEIKDSKKRVFDILGSIPMTKPENISEAGQYLKIYPSNEDEMRKIQSTFSHRHVNVRGSYVCAKTEGIVVRDRMVMNFVPDGYDPFMSAFNQEHYELFNVPESDENRLLFLNDKSSFVSRVYFMYKKNKILKMSPNIIQIRHIDGLTREFLDQLFNGLSFHKISPPLTPKGVWKLYVANRDDYLLLLSRPYLFGSKLLEITPYYESSLRLPLEKRISPSQIYLYSRSEKLSTTQQVLEAIPELSGVHIANYNYENRNLFIFHIYDRSKFLRTLHLNGSSLNGTTNYSITFGDDITSWTSFLSTAVIVSHFFNFCDSAHFTFPNILVIRAKLPKYSKQDIERIFAGIPIESNLKIRADTHHVIFSPENFQEARFRLIPPENFFTRFTSLHQSRILRETLQYCYINHFYYVSDHVVELPFEHHVVNIIGKSVNCCTSIDNYIKYCHRPIQTSKGRIFLTPYRREIANVDAFKFVTEQCSLMNIPVTFDYSREFIYPKFLSFSDLDLLTFRLFSEKDIYPEKARFYVGSDILEL
ncbi:hypothetical protein RF11_01280 [Thelohanellus kitauei]|uniref:Uncharacterized protein n=1 Tax=Thelohanellus kitauei TaxID=669202 RepID=A0A0C2MU31_THEKT|nr:hypothetical protein RF11_01280 [Thelohanellus kitauei]